MKISLFIPCALLCRVLCAAPPSSEDDNPDKQQYSIFHPAPREQMRDFNADRPSQTEGPRTIDAGHFQLEWDFLNAALDYNSPDRTHSETWNVVPLNIRVGLLNDLEFDLILDNFILSRTKDPAVGNYDKTAGIGDITTQFKFSLWGNDRGNTSFGIVPFVKLPLEASALRNGKTEGGLILPLDVKLPGGWDLGVMTEWAFVNDDTGGYNANFVNSIILGHKMTRRLSAYVEFLSVVSSASHFQWIGQIDVGLTWSVSENTQFDCGCNSGVTKAAPDLIPFVGFSVRF